MAGSLADYAENKGLDLGMGVAAWTMPTAYVALFTSDPTDTGAAGDEVSGGGYARVETSGSTWGSASSREIANAAAISFTKATANWGTITHFALFDASSGGNCIAHGDFTESKTIGSGDTATIATGDLDITVTSGAFSNYFANALLEHIVGKTSFSLPTVSIGLCTANPTDAGTGASCNEVADSGAYAREAIASDFGTGASGGSISNDGVIEFTEATASWGTVTHFATFDSGTHGAGNMLVYNALTNSKAVDSGDTASFAIGDLTVTLD